MSYLGEYVCVGGEGVEAGFEPWHDQQLQELTNTGLQAGNAGKIGISLSLSLSLSLTHTELPLSAP